MGATMEERLSRVEVRMHGEASDANLDKLSQCLRQRVVECAHSGLLVHTKRGRLGLHGTRHIWRLGAWLVDLAEQLEGNLHAVAFALEDEELRNVVQTMLQAQALHVPHAVFGGRHEASEWLDTQLDSVRTQRGPITGALNAWTG